LHKEARGNTFKTLSQHGVEKPRWLGWLGISLYIHRSSPENYTAERFRDPNAERWLALVDRRLEGYYTVYTLLAIYSRL